jgi:sugar phosphate isomerase/epimerase
MRQETGKDICINIDPSNLGLAGDDPVDAVYRLKGSIAGVHLKDSKYKGVLVKDLYPWMVDMVRSHHFGKEPSYTLKGPRPEFTPMGKGDVDFKGFIRALMDIGYKGCMVVEYEGGLCGYEETADKASRDSLRFIEKIIRDAASQEI